MTPPYPASSSLGRQALQVLLGLLVPLVALLIGASWWQSRQAVLARITDSLTYEADLAAQNLEAELDSLVRETAAVARNALVANAIADGSDNARVFLGPYLAGLHLSVPLTNDVTITSFDGALIWPAGRRLDPPLLQVITQAVKQGTAQASLQGDILGLVHPVPYAPTGTYEGAVAVTCDPGILLQKLVHGQHAGLVLLAGSRRLAGLHPDGPLQRATRALRLPAPLNQLHLTVEVSCTDATILAPLNDLLWLHLGLGGLALAVTGFTAWITVRRLTHRLVRLSQVAVAVTSDLHIDPLVPDLGEDEIGRLAASLRTMLQELARGRRELEDNVTLRTAQLSEAMALGKMGAWTFEVADGTFTFSDQFYRILRTTAEVQGGYLMSPVDYATRFIPAFCRGLVAQETQAALTSTNPDYLRILDHPVLFGDGTTGHLEVRFRTIQDAQGRVIQLVGVNQDITPRKVLEAELARSRDAAEAANRAKSVFLATMSHEIRTPLNGVLGMAQLLEFTGLNPDQKEMVETIGTSGRHLLTVINDILDFSKIEAGHLALECIPFRPGQVVDEVIALFNPMAQSKGLRLTSTIPRDVPTSVAGDPARLRQILANLIANAVKFTEQGEVTLTLECTPGTDRRPLLSFHVRDTGIGIPPDRLPDLFKPFVQADTSITRRFGGSGLGLVISQRLAELMGGDITVSSTQGHQSAGTGTTFTVRIQLPVVDSPITDRLVTKLSSDPGRQARILLAEDNPVNQRVASILLDRLGHRVVIADNGRAALELLGREDFDLVLMDCQMPVMDGFTATRVIRDPLSQVRNHRIPIIALTANAMQGDREACLAAGMDDYLSKPIQGEVLEQFLRRCLGGESGTRIPATGKRTAFPSTAIDHTELNRRMNDPALVTEVLNLARTVVPEQREDLRKAISGGDRTTINRAAHALAGTMGGIVATNAEQAARRLMAATRNGDPLEGLFTELEKALDLVQAALASG